MNYDSKRTDIYGDTYYSLNSQYHREDGPAVEYANGARLWYRHGRLHRLVGPAIERINGDKLWYIHGELHRMDGPAFINERNNTQSWYYHDTKIECSSQKQFESIIKMKAFW